MMTLSVWRPSWARKCTGSSSSTSSSPSYSTWLWKQSGASSTSKVDWKSGFRNQNLISGMVQFLIICVPPQAYSAYPIVIINNQLNHFISRNTTNLIYCQLVTGLGYYYSPLLPLVTSITLIITFYLQFYLCRFNFKLSKEILQLMN